METGEIDKVKAQCVSLSFKSIFLSSLFLFLFLFSTVLISSYNFEGDGVTVTDLPPATDYYMEVARGNVPGQSSINKFGNNPSTNAGDDIWGGGGTYAFYPTTAQSMDIVSTSTADDTGGTGAIKVVVEGLDSNWEVQTETVTLNGQTPVNLTNTYIRMYRAYVYEAGSSDSNVGDITVEIYDDTTTAIFIGADGGQTQHAIYTVPAGKSAYFIKGYVGISTSTKTAENAVFRWKMRLNNGLNSAWLTQGEIGLVNLGAGYWQYEYGVPAGTIPEKTDIKIELTSASDTFTTVGGFDLILIDN